ncbi:glycosyltransferase family 2 protein [Mucilaginibacter conchicola]|uniref:Glycosyltransferase family 2 protein n=1 Tax=Mucilaginibacter conchicola TaxID=2303333 RepID=A0A372NZL8_9SPHI|nr:glycosyltransferase family 2 protein [Mucilaginibacter conchicola]RFZ95314.1 glycosyltransferase family 2 protein [Mucilaginibacter conchicola]
MTESLDIIILTFNEEKNIEACLESVVPLDANIYIVDSGSTDGTLAICRRYTDNIVNHPFENYAAQRNWALNNLPLKGTWILNLDADHRVSNELAIELNSILSAQIDTELNGFLISRRTMFMNKWIKHGGHYPTYHANMFRRGFGACEDKLYDQHFLVQGKTQILKEDIIDIITDSVNTFVTRHNHWATLEAEYLFAQKTATNHAELIQPKFLGNPMQRRRYLKNKYESFPLFVRPILYFFIRYFIKLGFLDGKTGFVFHFLQGFWFRMMIDIKVYELQKQANNKQA